MNGNSSDCEMDDKVCWLLNVRNEAYKICGTWRTWRVNFETRAECGLCKLSRYAHYCALNVLRVVEIF